MFPFQIAFRFLKSSVGQTILIILGISVGVSVQVFIGSLIGGLQNSLVETTIGNSSQITIKNEEYIEDYQDIRLDIVDIDGIETVAYSLDAPGTTIVDEATNPILLRGFDLELSESIYELQDKLVSGTMPGNDEIIIGLDLIETLGLEIGDSLTISIPLVGDKDVTISGVYDFNVLLINNSWIISNLSTAQDILNTTDVVSSVEIQLEDVFTAEDIAILVATEVPASYEVTNWIDQNQELLTGLQGPRFFKLIDSSICYNKCCLRNR